MADLRGERGIDVEYLREIEVLAHGVLECAVAEEWFSFDPTGPQADQPLQQAIIELARHLRLRHYEGDGCLEH